MQFEKLDPAKEKLLEECLELIGDDERTAVSCFFVDDEIRELSRLGYIHSLEVEGDGRCSFFLTREGAGYFTMKEAWKGMPGPL